MKSTQNLIDEHKTVLHMVYAAELVASRLEITGKIDSDKIRQIVDFSRTFTDKCHHGKEEKYLFPLLEKRKLPNDGAMLQVMLHEHELGREYIRNVEKYAGLSANSIPDTTALHKNLVAYVELLREHVAKENTILFPMADSVLTAKDDEELMEAYEMIEKEIMGEGTQEKYYKMAHEIVDLARHEQ